MGVAPVSAVLFSLAVLAAFGMYREKFQLLVLDDFPRLAVGLVMALAYLHLLTPNAGVGVNVRDASWLVALGLWMLFELVAKWSSYSIIRSLRTRRR